MSFTIKNIPLYQFFTKNSFFNLFQKSGRLLKPKFWDFAVSATLEFWIFSKKKKDFFPQHIVEGLLNARRRVNDRPGWILVFKTPARKPTVVVVIVVFLFPLQKCEF